MSTPRDAALKQAILAAARSHPAPTRARARAQATAVITAAVALSVMLFLWAGGVRITGRPISLVVGTVAGAVVIAVVAATALWAPRKTMLDPSRQLLWTLVIATPVALFLWKVGLSEQFPDMTRPWPGRVGLRCLFLSLGMGLLPLVSLLLLRRDSVLVRPRTVGAAIGISMGAMVWVPVDLWCPVAFPLHLLLGHVLPMVLLALVGAVVGRRLLALRE